MNEKEKMAKLVGITFEDSDQYHCVFSVNKKKNMQFTKFTENVSLHKLSTSVRWSLFCVNNSSVLAILPMPTEG